MFNKVDLPQPEGPSRHRNSPSATCRSTPSSATYGSFAEAKTFRTLVTCSNLISRAQDRNFSRGGNVRFRPLLSQRHGVATPLHGCLQTPRRRDEMPALSRRIV